jgi:hypothetical protein
MPLALVGILFPKGSACLETLKARFIIQAVPARRLFYISEFGLSGATPSPKVVAVKTIKSCCNKKQNFCKGNLQLTGTPGSLNPWTFRWFGF